MRQLLLLKKAYRIKNFFQENTSYGKQSEFKPRADFKTELLNFAFQEARPLRIMSLSMIEIWNL